MLNRNKTVAKIKRKANLIYAWQDLRVWKGATPKALQPQKLGFNFN